MAALKRIFWPLSDLHEYLGGPNFSPVTPHKVTGATIPITFGHEFSGVISEVGEGVKGFKVGQNVAVQPTIYDGTCAACHRGLVNVWYAVIFSEIISYNIAEAVKSQNLNILLDLVFLF